MARILHRLPITTAAMPVTFPAGAATVRPNQIIAWVALTRPGYPAPPVGGRFPAVLDTGCSVPFILHRDHLDAWGVASTLRLTQLYPSSGAAPAQVVTVFGNPVDRWKADVWIFPNRPHTFTEVSGAAPQRMEVDDAIGICVSRAYEVSAGRRVPRPRLPLIGLPMLEQNGLRLTIDGGQRLAWLRRPLRLWGLRW